METWNDRLNKAMEARGKIAADLARVTKKKPASVSGWLSGGTKMMEADNSTIICDYLQIKPQWLFFGKGPSGLEETLPDVVQVELPLPVAEIQSTLDYVRHELVTTANVWCTDRPDIAVKGDNEELFFEVKHDRAVSMIDRLLGNIGRGNEGTIAVPVFSAAGSMGPGEYQSDHDTITGALQLAERWVRENLTSITTPRNLAVISGCGDSMSPTFLDGDVLLVDTGIQNVNIDGVYVLSANNRLYIKRVRQRLDGQFEISSDNPTVKTVDVLNGDQEVTIHGRVVWAWNGKKL